MFSSRPHVLLKLLSFEGRRDQDDPLLAALGRAEHDAMREVFVRYAPTMRAFARRLVGDNAIAEDLVQDVFVALPDAVKRFRGDSPLRAFLLGITANMSKSHVRAAARRRAAQDKLECEFPCVGARPLAPDEDVERVELARRLARALDALPHDQRVAFVLCEIEERTSVEVGKIVGATEETVRARVFHAKKKLRILIEREETSR